MIAKHGRIRIDLSWLACVPLMLGAALCWLPSTGHAEEWAADKPFTYPAGSDLWQRHNAILAVV